MALPTYVPLEFSQMQIVSLCCNILLQIWPNIHVGYSACELFSSELKDNRVAIIFGEDGTTGGGGATIENQNAFSVYAPDKFDALPYASSGLVDITFGWALGVRPQGRIIEDYGVESDEIIRPSLKDIVNPKEGTRQLDEIATVLKMSARKNKALCKYLCLNIKPKLIESWNKQNSPYRWGLPLAIPSR